MLVSLVLGAMRLLCTELVWTAHRLVRFGLYLQAEHQGFVVKHFRIYAVVVVNVKGKKILAAMQKEYGKEKGKAVFYASENKGTIKGVKKKGKSLLS